MKRKYRYEICLDCRQPMAPKFGCLYSHIEINGKEYKRIKGGDAAHFVAFGNDDFICAYCGVGTGQYHHFECAAERCPICNGQLIYCGCLDGADITLIQKNVGGEKHKKL